MNMVCVHSADLCYLLGCLNGHYLVGSDGSNGLFFSERFVSIPVREVTIHWWKKIR